MANMKVALIASVVGGGGGAYLSSNDKSLFPSELMNCQFDEAPYNKAIGGEILYATTYFRAGELMSMIIDHRTSGIDIGTERGDEIFYSVSNVPDGWKFDGWYTIPSEGFTPRHQHDGEFVTYEYDPDQYSLKVSDRTEFTMNDAFGAGVMDAAYTREVDRYPGSSTRYVTARFVEAVTITYRPGVDGIGAETIDTFVKGRDATIRGAIFTRTGYVQTGWATEEGGEKVYDLGQTINTSETYLNLYPVWEVERFPLSLVFSEGIAGISVSYVSGGMNVSDQFTETTTVYADYGSGYGAMATALSGYEVSGEAYVHGVIGEGGVTFAPEATLNSYTATFDANGGTGGTEKTQDYGTELVAPTVTRTGYTFTGWSPAVPATMPAADTTYVAQWTANRYFVTFNANGGSMPIWGKGVTYGAEYGELPTPTRSGYRFEGWYTELSGGTKVTETDVFLVADAQALYAHWAASSTPLVFDANGGGGAMTTGRVAVLGEPMPTGIALPSFTGHEFLGFYDAAQGGTMYYAPSGASARVWDKNTESSVTLYAHWRALVLVVSFDANGATISAREQLRVTMVGAQIGALPVPSPFDGRTFIGWFDGELKANAFSTFQTDTVLVAHWTHNISVDGEMLTVGLDDTITLDAQDRTGYTFVGYSINVDVEVDGESVKAGTPIPAGTTISLVEDAVATLIWAGSSCRVTYNPNGGDPIDASIYFFVVFCGQAYGEALTRVTPTREGYVFVGWSKTVVPDGGDAMILDPDTIVDEFVDHTLYAWWREENKVLLSFDPNGGTFGLQGCKICRSKAVGEEYGTLPVPTRERHNFVGWYKGQVQVTSHTEVEDGETEISLSAKWTEDSSYWYHVQLNRNSGTFPNPVDRPTDWSEFSVISLQEYYGMPQSGHLTQGIPYVLPKVAALGWQRIGFSLDMWRNLYARDERPSDEDEVVDGATITGDSGANSDGLKHDGLTVYKARWQRHENEAMFIAVDLTEGTVISTKPSANADLEVADIVDVEITESSPSYGDVLNPPNDEYSVIGSDTLNFYADPQVLFAPHQSLDGIGALVSVKGSAGVVSTGIPWNEKLDEPQGYVFLYRVDDLEVAVDWVYGNGARGAVYCSAGESISGDGRSASVSKYGVVHVAARPKQGYRFDGWFLDAEGTEPFDGAAEFTMLATENLTLYARFERNPSYIYRWEGGDRNMPATWRSKTYVGSKPFNAAACRVDALGYVGDGDETELRLRVDSFSSPNAAATSSVTLDNIRTQDARRLPRLRPERYLQVEVEANVEVDALFIGTSMEGLAV